MGLVTGILAAVGVLAAGAILGWVAASVYLMFQDIDDDLPCWDDDEEQI